MKSKPGFTVVELLIVIVVIGILAAISIVSYTGIQNRASNTAVQNDLKNLAKILELDKVDRGSFDVGHGFLNSGNTKFNVSNQSSYSTSPKDTTNLTICLTINGTAAAIAARSSSEQAYYTYSGDRFQIKEMTTANWTSPSSLSFQRCQSINPSLSPIRPGYTTYMNYNGYSSTDTTNGPWRAWTRGQ